MLGRLLKLLHELGAIGVLGSFACCLVLVATAPPSRSLAAYAAVRQSIAAISHWLLVPSLALVVVSGLLAIAANKAYVNAGWAWFKAALGLGMFEGTLLTVAGSARRAAELSALAAAGKPDPAEIAQVLHAEWGGLWVLLALSIANIVLAVWRPRFKAVEIP
jgi:hypothetical protein